MPKDLFWIDVTREQVQEEVEKYLIMESMILEQVKEIEDKLTF
jgi:hypothetical protein